MSDKIILLELHYLPCVEFVSRLLEFSQTNIEQHENYSKGSYRNRCHIATAQGLLALSVPLRKGKNEQQNIREVRIAYDQPWQSRHWTAIQSAYGKSPYFEFYADGFLKFYKKKYEFLWDWNWEIFQYVITLLSIENTVKLTDFFEPVFRKNPLENVLDFRNKISPKPPKKSSDDFSKITSSQFRPARYAQVFEERNGFLPNLSILDLLFCTGPEAVLFLEKSILKI